jgi:hypothetical protein
VTAAEILALLLTLAIPVASPEHVEEPDARRARLEEVARDFAAADVRLPGYSKREAVLLSLATAYHESGFALDVDVGPCYRGRDGKGPRCDHGKAKCLFQVHGSKVWPTRPECIRIGVSAMRQSLRACDFLPRREQLAQLGGSCTNARGREGSREMFVLFDSLAVKAARAKVTP